MDEIFEQMQGADNGGIEELKNDFDVAGFITAEDIDENGKIIKKNSASGEWEDEDDDADYDE